MQIDSFLFLLLVELLLVTTAVAITVVVVSMSRKQKDKRAVRSLVGRIKEDRLRRKDETRDLLISRYGLDEDAAKELSTQIDRGERYFYQTMINTYMHRDHLLLENLNVEFESSVEPYRSLEVKGLAKVTEAATESEAEELLAAGGEAGGDSAECERLRIENVRLSQELRITMETMGRMLNEYSNMFGGGADSDGAGQRQLLEMFEQMRDGLQQAGHLSIEDVASDQPALEGTPAEEPPEEEPLSQPEETTDADEEEAEIADAMYDAALSGEEEQADLDEDVLAAMTEDAPEDEADEEDPFGLEEDLEASEPEAEPEPELKPELEEEPEEEPKPE